MWPRPFLCQLACLLACLLSCLLFLAGCTALDSPRRDTEPVVPVADLVVDGVPSVPESILAGLDRYRNTHSASLLPDVTAAFGGARYGPDRSVYFTSDMNSEFRRMHRPDLDGGATRQ